MGQDQLKEMKRRVVESYKRRIEKSRQPRERDALRWLLEGVDQDFDRLFGLWGNR